MTVAAIVAPVPLAAQEPPAVSVAPAPKMTAREAFAAAREAYRIRDAAPPAPRCDESAANGEIVVCADPMEDAARYRIRSPRKSEADYAAATMNSGNPSTPDVGTSYPGVKVAGGCFIPPCPPPRAVLIDLKAIPEPPAGSDADRIAKGERAP